MSTFRGFIAIEIDASKKIIDLENEIKNSGANVKLVEPENIHITLKFLGDTKYELIDSVEKIIKESVKDTEPFEINLKGSGVFPNRNYMKVLWVGIENGEKIGLIADKIDQQITSLGFEKERRKFSPHLTIARVRSAKNKDKLLKVLDKYSEVDFGKNTINSIRLMKSELTSEGPIYSIIKDIKL